MDAKHLWVALVAGLVCGGLVGWAFGLVSPTIDDFPGMLIGAGLGGALLIFLFFYVQQLVQSRLKIIPTKNAKPERSYAQDTLSVFIAKEDMTGGVWDEFNVSRSALVAFCRQASKDLSFKLTYDKYVHPPQLPRQEFVKLLDNLCQRGLAYKGPGGSIYLNRAGWAFCKRTALEKPDPTPREERVSGFLQYS